MRSAALRGGLLLLALLLGSLVVPPVSGPESVAAVSGPVLARAGAAAQDNCLTCHFGIEEMHPWEPLSCTDCHGGDGTAETMEQAHVSPRRQPPNDERILPLDYDPAWLRFKNPSNLRVIDKTCGGCHETLNEHFGRSLHATTAGHLSDGMYECGILPSRGSQYSMFLTRADPGREAVEGLERLLALPGFDRKRPREEFGSHYRDLPAKNCVRCHVWSPGVAIRGRLGLDGDYRSEGCATCHVTYANDGLSKSGDPTIDRFEPGHPVRHELTTAIPTDTCAHCHYGDASIGLNFRGLAQLYPGQPAGPEVPGTTDSRLNQTFYIDDPGLTPADVHHSSGMHCIDCHTRQDVMGDGNLYGQMPQAVEIECVDCHGTIDRVSDLVTSRGRRIDNLKKVGGQVILTSRVTGEEHVVKQSAHVVSPRHRDYNPRAAKAMTASHGRLECYTCHAGWSPNFFGFHFDRHEQFTQLDMMSGERTVGRVNTQEKVFATFRNLYLGWNSEGMIAPYMVGFSSMGSVYDQQGEVVLDQVMPVTAAGLSGMTLIHHQLHTTQKTSRLCTDCHRNPTALGLGSPNENFRLGRNFLFVGSSRGLDVIAINRKQPGDSMPIATLPMLGVLDVALETEPLQGFSNRAYLAVANRGVAVVDLKSPAFPRLVTLVESTDPRALVVAANRLYLADGSGGVRLFDISEGGEPRELARVASADARDLKLNWPHLYVADRVLGLRVIDVSRPRNPEVMATLDLDREDEGDSGALQLALVVLPSRPDRGDGLRTSTRIGCALACGPKGLRMVDVTNPKKPFLYVGYGQVGGRLDVTSVASGSKIDLGSPDGAIPTAENDYLFFTARVANNPNNGRVAALQITDPARPKVIGATNIGPLPADVRVMNLFNPPFLQTFLLVAGGDRIEIVDASKSDGLEVVGQFGGMSGARSVALESMPLDRLVDESGRAWKDISHEGARYFSRLEIDKILRAPVLREFEQIGPITPRALRDEQGARER